MENEKVQVDEKTAKMIEEMDKSLRNMEQSLGMDHPVIAKLLDSYATLLRNNNIRHLDALNMEARAKAIRAKNNKEQAQKQSEGLAETKQEKHITASQMQIVSRVIAVVLAGGFLLGGYQMYQWFDAQKNKKAPKAFKGIQIVKSLGKSGVEEIDKAPAEPIDGMPSQTTTIDQSKQEQTQETSVTQVVDPTQPNPDGTGTTSQVQTTTTTTTTKLNVLELGEKMRAVKELAKQRYAEGYEAEQAKDYPKASALYFEVVQNTQNSAQSLGRPVFSEDIAKCYEGYGRMAELDAHPEIARQCEQTAAEIRAHIND